MANLFGGADLFGNRIPQDFNPEWQDPTSGVVDVGGNVTGNVNLNPYDYASKGTADQMGGVLGLPGQTSMASGPGASTNVQYELATGTPGHALNAGRVAQQMQYATKGRYNQDTGGYDKEDPAAIMARLKADIAPPMLDSQRLPTSTISPSSAYQYPNYIGKNPMTVGGYNPVGGPGQPPMRTTPQGPQSPQLNQSPGVGGNTGSSSTGGDARARMVAALRARLRGGQRPPSPSAPNRPV